MDAIDIKLLGSCEMRMVVRFVGRGMLEIGFESGKEGCV